MRKLLCTCSVVYVTLYMAGCIVHCHTGLTVALHITDCITHSIVTLCMRDCIIHCHIGLIVMLYMTGRIIHRRHTGLTVALHMTDCLTHLTVKFYLTDCIAHCHTGLMSRDFTTQVCTCWHYRPSTSHSCSSLSSSHSRSVLWSETVSVVDHLCFGIALP